MDIAEFKDIIYRNFEKAGRRFPWRENCSPWGVLVSEFMLQQTQTERVIPYFAHWMTAWPTPESFYKASLEEALRSWSGLGYNRRCRLLKECAAYITVNCSGRIPQTPETLLPLPGIGPYTSGAIACFAYNYPAIFIETNIRAVMLHFFFKGRTNVKDADLVPFLEASLDKSNPRKWYWALMDYGVILKKLTINPNRRSAHYAKQSKFEGSFRQRRGKIVKILAASGSADIGQLEENTGMAKEELYPVLEALKKDLMIAEHGGKYKISG
jgi:A/G-specific adenine glycosylase